MEYEAECAIYVRVKFTDDGIVELKDQAHDALMLWLDVPWDRLDDAEIVSVKPLVAGQG